MKSPRDQPLTGAHHCLSSLTNHLLTICSRTVENLPRAYVFIISKIPLQNGGFWPVSDLLAPLTHRNRMKTAALRAQVLLLRTDGRSGRLRLRQLMGAPPRARAAVLPELTPPNGTGPQWLLPVPGYAPQVVSLLFLPILARGIYKRRLLSPVFSTSLSTFWPLDFLTLLLRGQATPECASGDTHPLSADGAWPPTICAP